jgi:hypothetical protein
MTGPRGRRINARNKRRQSLGLVGRLSTSDGETRLARHWLTRARQRGVRVGVGVGVGSRSGSGSGVRSGPVERAWFGGEHADRVRILLMIILLIIILILIPSSIHALPSDAHATGNPSIEIWRPTSRRRHNAGLQLHTRGSGPLRESRHRHQSRPETAKPPTQLRLFYRLRPGYHPENAGVSPGEQPRDSRAISTRVDRPRRFGVTHGTSEIVS